jgi:O-antigen/teichoic acid export membrane protein
MSGFWRSVVSVMTGTAVAQVIPVVGSLVLARLYAPAQFGFFSAWLGVVLLAAVVFTGRFETALAIEPDGEPRRLAVISTLATASLAAVLSAAVLGIAVGAGSGWLGNIPTVLIVTSVPTALAIAAAQTWQSWAAAEGSYRPLSAMRIAQATAVTALQIVIGYRYASAESLAIAHFLGVIVGLAYSARVMPCGTFPDGKAAATIRDFWNRQRRFPLFSLPADSINTAAAQLPVLIVAGRFGTEIAGLLAMAMRILGAPIGLLGKSVLDVFKRHAAASFRERGECRSDYLRTFKALAFGSVVFCLILAFSSESLFAFAFGENWRGAGTIAVWLLPLFALRFIASPLSYMVYIAGKQHLDLIWQVALLGMTLASLNLPQRHDHALQAYSAGYALLYVAYLVMSYRFSLGKGR